MKSYDPKEMEILLAEARMHQECIDEEDARPDRRASITLRYDPDDPGERQHAARIVGGDYERMRCALFAVSERLRRIARGKDEVPELSEYGALRVLALIEEELDGVSIE